MLSGFFCTCRGEFSDSAARSQSATKTRRTGSDKWASVPRESRLSTTIIQPPVHSGPLSSLEGPPSDVALVRELQPQLLLLNDFAQSRVILARQREAFPFAVAPAWPEPTSETGLASYAETCCLQWFWGRNRLVDPARAFHICGFGSAATLAFAMGQHLSLMGHKPASVVVIGGRGAEPARSATLVQTVWGRVNYRFQKLLGRLRSDEDRTRWLQNYETIQRAADEADPEVLEWVHRMLPGWRHATELAPFPIFELTADESADSSSWIGPRRCQVRGSQSAIGVWHAVEVNAFLLRILGTPIEGLHIPDFERTRTASATLEHVARLIAESETHSA
jgi:hypothetical protein